MPEFDQQIHPWNQALWQQLSSDQQRQNHALLLVGQEGLGKLDLGFALARHIVTGGHEQSQHLFAAGSHPDMHFLLPEFQLTHWEEGSLPRLFAARYQEEHGGKPRTNITINQVRSLAEALTTHPHIAKHRVILIGYAESMNRNAANALLKNLEEPPSNTVFVLVSDDASLLPATIRSRCSVIPVATPSLDVGKIWLQEQSGIPEPDIESYLAMANNQPLLAKRLHEEGYVETLKAVFTDVNGLWSRRSQSIEAAKRWQDLGGLRCLNILQKLCVDMLRCKVSDQPHQVFFPVQQSWVASSATKLSTRLLLQTLDQLADAKRLIRTTVDELLVLETVSYQISQLPKAG